MVLKVVVLVMMPGILFSRSIHRTQDPFMPSLTARWVGDRTSYNIKNYRLDPHPFFYLFDEKFFTKHTLPDYTITYRYDHEKSVSGKDLKKCIDRLMKELHDPKNRKHFSFTDFTLLQYKDFNKTKGYGLLVLKFKEYPFVLKLFIERPETFISPYHKGLEPIFFFYMGGGINRHLSGFTRLKNLENIRTRIAQNEYWSQRVDTPRKWYWIPKKSRWIELEGINMGQDHKKLKTAIPGTYCIIADAIEAEKKMSLLDSASEKKEVLDLCNYLNLCIDPHLNNYFVEKGTGKLVIIDTEHFASFVGLKEPVHFDSYPSWYCYLAGKFLQNTFGQTKKERRCPQKPHAVMTLC